MCSDDRSLIAFVSGGECLGGVLKCIEVSVAVSSVAASQLALSSWINCSLAAHPPCPPPAAQRKLKPTKVYLENLERLYQQPENKVF